MANSEMYLHRRANGVFYFRRRVPSDLVGIIKPSQFHYSLEKRSRNEALKPYAAALSKSEYEIEQARKKLNQAAEEGRATVYPSWRNRQRIRAEETKRKGARVFGQYDETDLNRLIAHWFESERRKTETFYRDAFTLNRPEERERFIQELHEEGEDLLGKKPGMDDMVITRAVRSILDEEDCEAPKEWLEDASFRRFYGYVTEGLLGLNKIALSLVETGQMPERIQPLAFPALQPQGDAFSPTSAKGKGVTLEMLIERFHSDPKRQSLRKGTRDEYHFIYRALREEIGGERLLSSISREDIRAISDTFRHLPARITLTNQRDKLKDIATMAKAQGQPLANVKTFNKRIQSVSALFNYAVIEMLIAQNPARNLSLPEPRKGDEPGFSVEQLQLIFGDQMFLQFTGDGEDFRFQPNHPMLPCYFWVPPIGLFHGMRLNEILQIKTVDVFEKDSVMILKSVGELKGNPAHRSVPLHPTLVQIGFLSYLKAVKEGSFEYLFPDAKAGAYGKFSNWFTKPFARCLKRTGVKKGRKECFHTFRHTWNGALRRASVPEEIRRKLGGWKDEVRSSETNYGPHHFPNLLKAQEKVEFPELDLSPLLPRRRKVVMEITL